jgi:hypothetical protein
VYVLGDIFIMIKIVIAVIGFPEHFECNIQACFLLTFTNKWNIALECRRECLTRHWYYAAGFLDTVVVM